MRVLKRILLGFLATLGVAYAALWIFAYWPMETGLAATILARPADRFVSVGALRLRYRSYGHPGPRRPELVLLHGFGNSLQSWRLLAPLLADCCRVVAIDMPGYGLSDKPVDYDYHNGPQAGTIVAAARALGLERPVYVGHSLGGAIALHAALQDRQSVGLVLMNPGIITTGVPKIVQLTIPPLPRLSARQFASRSFRSSFLRKSYLNPAIVTEQVIDDVMLAARSDGYMAGMTSLMKQYAEGEEIALCGRVRTPTLIVWGNQDRNKALTEADDLQRLIPGSKLVRFDGAGHYVHEERPQAVATAIEAWLARTSNMAKNGETRYAHR
jgi:pimeloyl-ACP methyl ester carboxylesterase